MALSAFAATLVVCLALPVSALAAGPTVSAPADQAMDEDTTLTLSGANAMSVADADGGDLEVTLSSSSGKLTLATIAGLSFDPANTDNNGTDDANLHFTGSIASINAALD